MGREEVIGSVAKAAEPGKAILVGLGGKGLSEIMLFSLAREFSFLSQELCSSLRHNPD